MLFRRTKLTSEIADPFATAICRGCGSSCPSTKPTGQSCLAVLVAALIQVDVPHVVLLLIAEQGSAKSSITRILVSLVDPSPVPLRQPPRDPDGWTTAAAASWVVALDNLSGQLSDWLSDSLCRASTGDGQVKRALYTDDDVAVTAYPRVVIANGVDVVIERGDLAERVGMHRPAPHHNPAPRDRARPSRGPRPTRTCLAVCSTWPPRYTSDWPTITVTDLPRMADFARVLAAVDEVLGTKGLDRYRERARSGPPPTLSTTRSSPSWSSGSSPSPTRRRPRFCPRSSPLLSDWKPPRDWPKNARAVTGQLTRHAPALRGQGWVIDHDAGRNEASTRKWNISPPEKVSEPDPSDPPNPSAHVNGQKPDGSETGHGSETGYGNLFDPSKIVRLDQRKRVNWSDGSGFRVLLWSPPTSAATAAANSASPVSVSGASAGRPRVS